MAASTNLATLEYVKSYLGLTGSDYDSLLTSLVAAASQAIEEYCRREFNSAERTEYHDGRGAASLLLNQWPVSDIASIYDDLNRDFTSGTVVDSDDYTFEPKSGRVRLLQGRFQDGVRNVKVTYTAGYENVPDDVAQACALLAAAWFNKGRQGGDGLADETLGDYRATYDAEPWPAAIYALLAPYRQTGW